MIIKTIIVEDEPLSMFFLKNLLAEYCPQVNVIATPATEDDAVAAIASLQPDLVLMDIELQQGNGLAVLQRTRQYSYAIIFTTALDYSGIRAIRFSGVNYLQKPIDIDALQAVIQKIAAYKTEEGEIAVQHLLTTLDNNNQPTTLLLNTAAGNYYVSLQEIIYITIQNTGCIFYTETNAVPVTGSSLKDYEVLLNELGFFRPHADYIIRLDKVNTRSKIENGNIALLNNILIPVSPKRQAQLGSLLFSPA
ncbi:MAG: response regulator transcription factor [Rhizobacter sp.]|nr:response regulator transcription factor [Ferruginibacter sp.]